MNIRLICMDLDGTALQKDRMSFSPRLTAALEKADARKEQDIEEMKAYIQELEQASFLSQPVSSLSAKLLHIFHHSRRNK